MSESIGRRSNTDFQYQGNVGSDYSLVFSEKNKKKNKTTTAEKQS